MNEFDWYGLDNAAKIFPAISGDHTSSVFRVGVRLTDGVNPETLKVAVNRVLPSFPAFMVRIRKGFFWYYLEKNDGDAPVTEENFLPCSHIDADQNAGYLFRFSYYRNKINLDVYHVLSDGTGAINFLNAVLECYVKLCDNPEYKEDLKPRKTVDFPMMEDSFSRLASEIPPGKPKNIKAYHIKGTPMPKGNTRVLHGIMDTGELIRLVKSKNVSVTSYMAAVLAFSIYKTIPAHKELPPLRINVPVNLRRFFETETQRNFFTFITLDVDLYNKVYTFDDILQLVAAQLEERVKPEYFMPRINYYIEAERNIFARMTPLFIKNFALRLIYLQSGDETFTCSLSNLGVITPFRSAGQWVSHYDFLLGISKKNHLNCAICSYQNYFEVSFTNSDYETTVEKEFFRFLTGQGFKITIEQN